jgi:hypothetical protein
MKTVYKYELPTEDIAALQMPAGAELLHVGVQGSDVMLWARVDPDAPCVTRRVRFAGTGHPLGEGADAPYVGTALLYNGRLVFHVFDLGEA